MGSTTMMYILPMILGQTYDLGKEKPGIPIFLERDMENARMIEQYFTEYQYKMIKNSADVKNFLDISGKLALKIKGGMVNVNGEGSYIKHSSSKTNGLEILIKVHFETVTKTFSSSVKPRRDWMQFDKEFLGTHFCRSITYGGDLIASVRISASNSFDLERIKGSVDGSIKGKGNSFSAEIKARLDKLKNDAQDSSSMEISYYATVPLDGISYDVDGLLKLVNEFPDQVKRVNNGIGNPLRMELYPLSFLESNYPAYLENRALNELLSDVEDQFDDLRATRKAIGTWLSELPPVMNAKAEHKISEFADIVNTIFGIYLETIEELDLARGTSTDPIYNAIDAYKHDEYVMYQKYIRQFHKLQKDIYTEYEDLKPKIGGASYIHWGKNDCPSNGSEMLTSGLIVASENSQTGGSSDYICSPLNPDLQNPSTYFSNYDPDEDEDRGIIVSPLRFNGELITNYKDKYLKKIACAQCRISYRTSVLVKPASKTCPKGFVKEYEGVLMAPGRSAVSKGSYICVDVDMQLPYEKDSVGDEYFSDQLATIREVVISCKLLPCPSYEENKPIPCVVCTI